MKTLVICSGNICRSPMVAAYLRQRLAHTGMSHVVVSSAGTLGIEGAPAAPEAIRAMAEIGVDLKEHRSRALTAADLQTGDIVIVMDWGHMETLASRFPEGRGARYMLRAFEGGSRPSNDPRELEDPIGASFSTFCSQRDLIRVCVDHLVLHLKHSPISS